MKKLIMNKTAAVLVFAMMIAALTPIIAFAASFNLTQSGNTVSGNITLTDAEYADLHGEETIAITVYGADGTSSSVTATYTGSNGVFDIPDYTVTQRTYFSITTVEGVYESTYFAPQSSGSFYIPPVSGDGVVNADGTVNRASLIALLTANDNAVITTTSEVVLLPADALIQGKFLTIKMADGTSYTLPIAALHLEDTAKALGVELADLTIRVEMKKVTGDTATDLAGAVDAAGGKALTDAVDFKVVAVAGDKEQEYTDFGQYVSRTLGLKEVVTDTNHVTGVLYNPETGEFSFVPTTFDTENDKTIATLQRNGNSIYTVVQVDGATFEDIADHWAQADIETLASKLIVEGTGNSLFEPKRNITRAEFAALVVRSLGIVPSGSSDFSDVATGKWYNGVVAAAAAAGIVQGDDKGNFNPDAFITRKELSAMVVRAMKYAGHEVVLTDDEVTAALAAFTDAGNLGWATEEVAAAVKSGVVQGQTNTLLVGNANATRAEAVTMIIRYLGNVGFING